MKISKLWIRASKVRECILNFWTQAGALPPCKCPIRYRKTAQNVKNKLFSNLPKIVSFKYFWTLESAYESWELVHYEFWKKFFFQALENSVLEKEIFKNPTNQKNDFFFNLRFVHFRHLEVAKTTSKQNFWIFQII